MIYKNKKNWGDIKKTKIIFSYMDSAPIIKVESFNEVFGHYYDTNISLLFPN